MYWLHMAPNIVCCVGNLKKHKYNVLSRDHVFFLYNQNLKSSIC